MEKVALITGSGRGIGRGIAMALAEHHWRLVVNYLRNRKAAEKTAEQIGKLGTEFMLLQADIALPSGREKLVGETLNTFGRIDLLVNNAGMAPRQRMDLLKTTEKSFDEVLQVNLKGPFFLTQLVAVHMIELVKHGKISSPMIVNIGSISATVSSIDRAEYCLSKAGMGMMTSLFAGRLAQFGINVYEVRPGIIATDMTAATKEKYNRLIARGLTPIRRWGTPSDVAKAVVTIAEGNFPFSTGEIIYVDGGFHLQRL